MSARNTARTDRRAQAGLIEVGNGDVGSGGVGDSRRRDRVGYGNGVSVNGICYAGIEAEYAQRSREVGRQYAVVGGCARRPMDLAASHSSGTVARRRSKRRPSVSKAIPVRKRESGWQVAVVSGCARVRGVRHLPQLVTGCYRRPKRSRQHQRPRPCGLPRADGKRPWLVPVPGVDWIGYLPRSTESIDDPNVPVSIKGHARGGRESGRQYAMISTGSRRRWGPAPPIARNRCCQQSKRAHQHQRICPAG